MCSYMNNLIVGSFFHYWHNIKKYIVDSSSKERLTFIEPFFESKFAFKPDIIESPTIVHVPFGEKALKFWGFDGYFII